MSLRLALLSLVFTAAGAAAVAAPAQAQQTTQSTLEQAVQLLGALRPDLFGGTVPPQQGAYTPQGGYAPPAPPSYVPPYTPPPVNPAGYNPYLVPGPTGPAMDPFGAAGGSAYRQPTPAERAAIEAALRGGPSPMVAPSQAQMAYAQQRDQNLMLTQNGGFLITESVAGQQRVRAVSRQEFTSMVAELVATGQLSQADAPAFVANALQESNRAAANLMNERSRGAGRGY